MTIFYKVYSAAADSYGPGASSTSYSTARANTVATTTAGTTGDVGQIFSAGNYSCRQCFFQFDTSAIPTGGTSSVTFNVTAAKTVGSDSIEVRSVSSLANKIAGGSINAITPQYGTATMPVATGLSSITLTADPPRTAALKLLLSSANERNNVAATAFGEQCTVNLSEATGTTNDPFFQVLSGTAWAYVAAGTSVQATATSHILTEPAGVAAGDLLVACIASRIASTTAVTLPAGWTLVEDNKNNNILSTSGGQATGTMAYIIRGASPPSYTFTHPVAPDVALGRVVAYRNVQQTMPLDVAVFGGTATATLACSWAGLPSPMVTTADDDLIVAMVAGGQEATYSGFNATDPGTGSGATASSVLDPIWGQWLERAEQITTTGADTALAIFDAVKQTAGGTGSFVVTATVSAAHTLVAGAFKIAPPAPTGTTYNETVAETLSAAEEVAISLFERSGPVAETAASADTVAGLLDATRAVAETAAAAEALGGLLVTEKAIAETATAAETLTGGLAFVDTVAETAAAVDTVAGQFAFAGATAESTSAVEAVTGQFNTTKAIVETAAAVETAAGLLTFTSAIAETAAAAETLTGGLAFSLTLAETASAADTISKAVSFTGDIAETASAADTAGGLLVRSAAIAESASAAETTVGLLTFTAAIAETESAAETITYSVESVGGTTFNEAQAETATAAETVVSVGLFTGAIAEAASAADTTTKAVSYTKDVAETATAAETVTKTIIFAGAIAETASAAETTAASLIPASVVYNVGVAETASAAEIVAATLVATKAIAEVATAAETITKAVSYTRAVIETAAAVDTVGRLVGHDGAIAETVSATDTITTTLDATRGVAEIAAAVDSITHGHMVPWRRDPSAWQAWATDTPSAATGWTRAARPSATWRVDRTGSVIRITELYGTRISEDEAIRLSEDGQERATETILMQSRRVTTDGRTRIIERVNVDSWIKTPSPANTWRRAYA